jgi:hypothetical protein
MSEKFFTQIAPYLGAAGNELVNFDENTTGADDFAGELLVYTAEVIAAIAEGEDLPPFPDKLAQGTQDKISGAAKITLRIASATLTIAQFQVSGKAATVLKYVNAALRNLLAGKPVSPQPAF